MVSSVLKNLQISLPGRYARALFDIAAEDKNIEFVLSALQALNTAINGHNIKSYVFDQMHDYEFSSLIESCAVELKWPVYLVNFFKVLHQAKRMELLSAITEIFEKRTDDHLNRVSVEVQVPSALNQNDQTVLESKLSTMLDKSIRFNYKIEPELLGGFVATVNNSLQIDASLLSQINQLHTILNRIPLKGVS